MLLLAAFAMMLVAALAAPPVPMSRLPPRVASDRIRADQWGSAAQERREAFVEMAHPEIRDQMRLVGRSDLSLSKHDPTYSDMRRDAESNSVFSFPRCYGYDRAPELSSWTLYDVPTFQGGWDRYVYHIPSPSGVQHVEAIPDNPFYMYNSPAEQLMVFTDAYTGYWINASIAYMFWPNDHGTYDCHTINTNYLEQQWLHRTIVNVGVNVTLDVQAPLGNSGFYYPTSAKVTKFEGVARDASTAWGTISWNTYNSVCPGSEGYTLLQTQAMLGGTPRTPGCPVSCNPSNITMTYLAVLNGPGTWHKPLSMATAAQKNFHPGCDAPLGNWWEEWCAS